MRRRTLAVAATLLVVALAGCSVAVDDDETVTPAPVPDAEVTAAPTPTPSSPSFVDEAAVSNARAIAGEHRRSLANRTYRVRERFNWSRTGPDTANRIVNRTGSTIYTADGRVVHDRARFKQWTQWRTGQNWTNTSTYSDGERRYIRRQTNRSTNYSVAPADSQVGRVRPNMTRTVSQLLAARETDITETTVDGGPGYRFVGNGSANGLFNTFSDYRVVALVDEDGVVRRIETYYSSSSLGVTTTGSHTFVIDPVPNATVTEPDWVETARQASEDSRSLDRSEESE